MIPEKATPLNIGIIGASGSVGSSVLGVIRSFPGLFRVHSLAGGSNAVSLGELCEEFSPSYATLWHREARDSLEKSISHLSTKIFSGEDPLLALAEDPEVDHLIFASSGTRAIPALRRALELGKIVSLANKESIVVGGPWIMPLVKDLSFLRPLDSEHNALWQCLKGEDPAWISKLVLTASGGPFRKASMEELRTVSGAEALRHPVWNMGKKITLDSATLMNKGFEVLEASQLFRIPLEKIEAWVHPGSRVHGIVHFIDGCTKYLASSPDMRIPAAVALSWPERIPFLREHPSLRAEELPGSLEFFEPRKDRFRCLSLAYEAGKRGGAYPALLVGADEVAVEAFLDGKIGFLDIPRILEEVLERYSGGAPSSLEEAIALVERGREMASEAEKKVDPPNNTRCF
ncbi:MAG TPA: 1-deoxy-D-xylulose-5-phosphate reductoisomerase [Synergistaceae bacterium]|nr:1-deoxy-D-xylulose-5-phosphate reductoisomerase [Synergistaceae bacterium]HPJ25108.1 1-deoxy-D-xylulose-5-phosphate reductoisomerase [Synergistaceae bacterium]HPQ36587.1 1-deoxy-D-xylulose-5-phosphate reductoisomerase [Synergistaceae bacterium]